MKNKLINLGIIGLLITIWLINPLRALAEEFETTPQSTTWSSPVNLSNSGGASDPLIVKDSLDVTHVIWQDIFDGFVYSQKVAEDWSSPLAVQFSFDPYLPTLLADQAGNIHVFWLDEIDGLFYSRTSSSNFGNADSWLEPRQIAETALAFDVVIDQAGDLYLVYIRPLDSENSPAGVYFHSSRDRGASWSQAVLLQESRYFRNLTRDTANVQISTVTYDEVVNIYAVWDNPARGRIFFARSNDGGQNWEPPNEIDQTQVATALSGPFNVNLSAYENQVLVLWQVGQAGVSCTHHYRLSSDNGQTWSDNQRFLQQLTDGGCPRELMVIPGDGPNTLLYINVLEDVYLSVWDGSRWSQPQFQIVMSNFPDPEIQTSVELRCRNVIKTALDSISVVGCDIGSGKDVWYLERSLGDINDWFPPPSAWTSPSVLTQSDNPITSYVLITDPQGKTHALWAITNGINYSRWEQGGWLESSTILRMPNETINYLAAQIDASGRLHIAWTTTSGGMFHSWANVERASIGTEWITSRNITDASIVGESVDLLVSPSGRVHIVYSIPINEGRGIYLVQSDDQGVTWSEPVLVFDASVNGWEIVDSPQIRETGGVLHVVWNQRQFADMSHVGAYYSNSSDGGSTWSPFRTIVDVPITYTKLLAHGNQTVHLIWIEESGDRLVSAHEVSHDMGETWNSPSGLGTIGMLLGPTDATIDPAGQLHLLQFIENITGEVELIGWLWNGLNWTADQSLILDQALRENLSSLAVSVSAIGQVIGVYRQENPADDQSASSIVYSFQRMVELPDELPTPIQVATSPTPTPPMQGLSPEEDDPQIKVTPTLDVNLLLQDQPASGDQSFLVVGQIAASSTAVVLTAIILIVWRRNSKK